MPESFLSILAKQRQDREASQPSPTEKAISVLPRRIEKFVAAWPQNVKPNNILRASQLHTLCPREFVLNYWQPAQGNFFDFGSYLRMGVGTFLHSFLQDVVLGPTCVLSGKWKNNATGETVEGFHPEPFQTLEEYTHQQAVSWTYVEPIVWEPHYRISGHVDGLVSKPRLLKLVELLGQESDDLTELVKAVNQVDCGSTATLEIKTTSSRILGDLTTYKDIAPYYQSQSTIYQKLTGCEETIFWFFERNDLSSRTIVMPHVDSWWQEVLRKGDVIWEAIRDETLPESMRKCLTPTDTRASTCPHAKACFTSRFDMAAYVDAAKKAGNREWLNLTDWVPKSI